ncbi:MAG: diguanylate cyclase [Oscillospiraceae bacterium]|nr:diguanylate cyclase [Oscillospiraceae bacterium]
MKKSNLYFLAAAMAFLVLVGIASFWNFSDKMYRHAAEQGVQQLTEYGESNAYSTKTELLNTVNLLRAAASGFSRADAVGVNVLQKELRSVQQNASFEEVRLANLQGRSINGAGSVRDLSSDRFFQRSALGECCICVKDDASDGTSNIMISVPMIAEGRVIGVLCGEYNLYALSKITNTESFNGEGYAVLVRADGSYVMSSASPKSLNTQSVNFLDFIGTTTLTGSSAADFRAELEKRHSGVLTCTAADQTRLIYYTPVGINDWYLMQFVTSAAINAHSRQVETMVLTLILEISLVLLLMGVLVNFILQMYRKARQEELNRFKTLADNVPGGVAEIRIGSDYVVQYANQGFFRLMGYSKEEYMDSAIGGRCLKQLTDSDYEAMLVEIRKQIEKNGELHLEYQIQCKNDTVKWVSTDGTVIKKERDGAVVQAILTDTTWQKQKLEKIVESARLEKMTQLYDKVSTQNIISQDLLQQAGNAACALIMLDIDNFKHFNDTYGHAVGDEVILSVARTIQRVFRPEDVKGRIGGDEFMVFLHNIRDSSILANRLETFRKAICTISVEGQTGLVSCSAGAALLPTGTIADYAALFQLADKCLYEIKRTGKGAFYIEQYHPEVQ